MYQRGGGKKRKFELMYRKRLEVWHLLCNVRESNQRCDVVLLAAPERRRQSQSLG